VNTEPKSLYDPIVLEATTGRDDSDASTTVPVLEADALSKSFGATRALVDGTLTVPAGHVVALLGENGSGKSTLVKILSGVLRPDSGTVLVEGAAAKLKTPQTALRAGIVTVFQEILVAPHRTVLQNLWLGNGPARETRKLDCERRKRASAVLETLASEDIRLDDTVERLDLMQQQVCVIARALLREPRLLILDESTSTLDITRRDALFASLKARCADGMAALFISHRMDEVLAVADGFVALRSGSVVGTRSRGNADAADLIRLISGEVATRDAAGHTATSRTVSDRIVVQARAAVLRPGSGAFDLSVRAGDIVGLAGLEGHGQDEFLRALAGLHRLAGGELLAAGQGDLAPVSNYRRSVACGVVYVPRDRKVEGMADVLPILDNYGLPTLPHDAVFGLVRSGHTRRRFRRDAGTVNFTPGKQQSMGRLSGGNQQKVIIARWLAAQPGLILLNDPTRGVDLKTKHELYDLFRNLAAGGAAVVMLSSEVDELVHLMDRVLVFHDGSVSADLPHDEVTSQALVAAYFGQRTADGLQGTR
jgi:ABC-type sugar transport system ATPase subunit